MLDEAVELIGWNVTGVRRPVGHLKSRRSPRSETDDPAPLKVGQSISTRIGEAL